MGKTKDLKKNVRKVAVLIFRGNAFEAEGLVSGKSPKEEYSWSLSNRDVASLAKGE